MDGAKLLLILLVVNIFLVVMMDYVQYQPSGSFLAPNATRMSFPVAASDDYVAFLGMNLTGYTDASLLNVADVTVNGTAGTTATTGRANRESMLGSIISFTGGSGSTDWLGLGAFTAMWHTIVWFISFVIYIIFAPVLFLIWIGLGSTIALPIFGIPYIAMMILLIVQFFWRFKP